MTLITQLDTPEQLAQHLAALLARDPRLAPVAARAGSFELRRTRPGFAGLARIICGQQLSVASANAIWNRFATLDGALMPETYLGLGEAEVRGAGFSLGKYNTLRGLAEALAAGHFAFEQLAGLPADEAIARLVQLKGIGPWTAELYLMFSAGHPDIFPAGDVALRSAIQWGLALDARPSIPAVRALAAEWGPHRSTAALLFWRYYRAIRDKEGLAL